MLGFVSAVNAAAWAVTPAIICFAVTDKFPAPSCIWFEPFMSVTEKCFKPDAMTEAARAVLAEQLRKWYHDTCERERLGADSTTPPTELPQPSPSSAADVAPDAKKKELARPSLGRRPHRDASNKWVLVLFTHVQLHTVRDRPFPSVIDAHLMTCITLCTECQHQKSPSASP